jgi:hypothetical protein
MVYEADVEFHGRILQATQNRVVGRVVAPIQRALLLTPRVVRNPQNRFHRTLDEHRRLAAAIANRHPDEARAAMKDHLASLGELIAEQIQYYSDTTKDIVRVDHDDDGRSDTSRLLRDDRNMKDETSRSRALSTRPQD